MNSAVKRIGAFGVCGYGRTQRGRNGDMSSHWTFILYTIVALIIIVSLLLYLVVPLIGR